jgi:hypothetical protein
VALRVLVVAVIVQTFQVGKLQHLPAKVKMEAPLLLECIPPEVAGEVLEVLVVQHKTEGFRVEEVLVG